MFCLMFECVIYGTSIAVVPHGQVLNDCKLLMHRVASVKRCVQRGTLVKKANSFSVELKEDKKLDYMSAV